MQLQPIRNKEQAYSNYWGGSEIEKQDKCQAERFTCICPFHHLLCRPMHGLHSIYTCTFTIPLLCTLYIYTAAQIWTLARNLHVTIGDLIPEGDIYWDTFLTLLDILDICMAHVVSNDMAAHLNLLIHDHHEAYREIYPDKPLLPKQHYMVHYPDWMKKVSTYLIYIYIIYVRYTLLHPCRPEHIDI